MGDKVNISPLTVEDNSSYQNGLNQRLDALADEFDKVVYRDGSLDFQGPLNANGQRIYNGGTPVAMSDFARLRDVHDILGALRGNADAALQFQKAEHIVTEPTDSVFEFSFEALSGYVNVYLNGVKLATSDYSHSGAVITLNQPAVQGDVVSLEGFTISSVVPTTTSILDTTGVTLQSRLDQIVPAFRLPIFVESFRTGTMTDLQTWQAALDQLRTDKEGTLIGEKGRAYDFGTIAEGATLFQLTGLRRAIIDGNGCSLQVTTVAGTTDTVTRFFNLTDFQNVVFKNIRFVDPGYSYVPIRGAAAFELSGVSGECRGFTMENIYVQQCLAGLFVNGAANQVKGIHFGANCVFDRVYYPANFQENGNFVTGDYAAINCVRPYFPYGVHDHDLNIHVYHDGVEPAGQQGVLIKRYIADTSNLNLNISFTGVMAHATALVMFEHQNDAGAAASIKNVKLRLNLKPTSNPHNTRAVAFRAYSAAGVETTTTTENKFESLVLEGDISALTSPIKIKSNVVPRLLIPLDISGLEGFQDTNTDGKGFRFKVGRHKEFYIRSGALTDVNNRVKVPTGNVVNRDFAAKVTTYAVNNAGGGSGRYGGVVTQQILGYSVGGAGGVVVDVVDTLDTITAINTGPTITYQGNPSDANEYFTVLVDNGISPSFYDNTASRLRVEVEWLNGVSG